MDNIPHFGYTAFNKPRLEDAIINVYVFIYGEKIELSEMPFSARYYLFSLFYPKCYNMWRSQLIRMLNIQFEHLDYQYKCDYFFDYGSRKKDLVKSKNLLFDDNKESYKLSTSYYNSCEPKTIEYVVNLGFKNKLIFNRFVKSIKTFLRCDYKQIRLLMKCGVTLDKIIVENFGTYQSRNQDQVRKLILSELNFTKDNIQNFESKGVKLKPFRKFLNLAKIKCLDLHNDERDIDSYMGVHEFRLIKNNYNLQSRDYHFDKYPVNRNFLIYCIRKYIDMGAIRYLSRKLIYSNDNFDDIKEELVKKKFGEVAIKDIMIILRHNNKRIIINKDEPKVSNKVKIKMIKLKDLKKKLDLNEKNINNRAKSIINISKKISYIDVRKRLLNYIKDNNLFHQSYIKVDEKIAKIIKFGGKIGDIYFHIKDLNKLVNYCFN